MLNKHLETAMPFVVFGALAILAGGLIAAATAHHPTRFLTWTVAYLVLVVGAMQTLFAAGQAWLARQAPSKRAVWSQWVLFNLGSAGVVGGTMYNQPVVVAAGTLLFVGALLYFFFGVRYCRRQVWGVAYRLLLGLGILSACVGLALSIFSSGE